MLLRDLNRGYTRLLVGFSGVFLRFEGLIEGWVAMLSFLQNTRTSSFTSSTGFHGVVAGYGMIPGVPHDTRSTSFPG